MLILSEKFEQFSKKIKSLSKKSLKISGQEITFEIKRTFFKEFKTEKETFYSEVKEVVINFPEIKIEGWKLLGKIEHFPEGNFITSFTCDEIDTKYRNVDSVCDHCNKKRKRNSTFILENNQNEKIQVGKSCLDEFLGIDSSDLLSFTKLKDSFDKETYDTDALCKEFSIKNILELSAQVIINEGRFVSGKTKKETGIAATSDLIWSIDKVSDEAKEIAKNAVEEFSKKDISNDYVYNCSLLIERGFVDFKKIGYSTSIVGTYMNKKANSNNNNVFVGKVGEKFEGNIEIVKMFDTRFGSGYTAITEQGESIFFFSNKGFSVGSNVKIVAKIKEHKEYENKKQTVLERVKTN